MAKRTETPLERVAHLVALDAKYLVERLEMRRPEMVAAFSRLRDRDALLGPLHSWIPSARFSDLVQLTRAQQRATVRFHEEVDALKWYFRYTNDMPGTLQTKLDSHFRRVVEAHAKLRAVLGEPDDNAVPPADLDHPRVATAPKKKRSPKK